MSRAWGWARGVDGGRTAHKASENPSGPEAAGKTMRPEQAE